MEVDFLHVHVAKLTDSIKAVLKEGYKEGKASHNILNTAYDFNPLMHNVPKWSDTSNVSFYYLV